MLLLMQNQSCGAFPVLIPKCDAVSTSHGKMVAQKIAFMCSGIEFRAKYRGYETNFEIISWPW